MLPQPRSILQYGSDEFAEPAVSSAPQVLQQSGAPLDGGDGGGLQVLRRPCYTMLAQHDTGSLILLRQFRCCGPLRASPRSSSAAATLW